MMRDLMTHMSGLSYHFVDESPVGKMYHGAKLLDAERSLEAVIDDWPGFRLLSSQGHAGGTASGSTSPPE